MRSTTGGHTALIRTLLLAALVLGVAGGATAASVPAGNSGGAGLPEVAAAVPLEPADVRRAEAAYQRVDRRFREAAETAVALAEAESEAELQRVPRAVAAKVQPAPPPPPPEGPAESAPGGSAPSAPAPAVPASCGEYSGNRATGCALLLEAGFDLDQMGCLDSLWERESGWNHLAENPSSGAYGIPQALPGDKMASHGDDWRTNPSVQIRWGLDYIADRYGTPCAAWNHSEANGWY